MEQLSSYDSYVAELKAETARLEERLKEACGQLSDVRKKYASRLVRTVEAALRDLNFLDVSFDMQFDQLDHYTSNGTDDGEFMISTNPGEPLKPLRNIASGGEMSRIMLAMKTVLAENDAIDTLIFDEIDSGISGRTAQAVSEKLSVVARDHQVVCITHLPQIAAMGIGIFSSKNRWKAAPPYPAFPCSPGRAVSGNWPACSAVPRLPRRFSKTPRK